MTTLVSKGLKGIFKCHERGFVSQKYAIRWNAASLTIVIHVVIQRVRRITLVLIMVQLEGPVSHEYHQRHFRERPRAHMTSFFLSIAYGRPTNSSRD